MKVGFAKEEIIFKENIDLIGFVDRRTGAKGIHDKLFVKCLIIENCVFITCDLLALANDFCEKVRFNLKKNGCEVVIISCTHTHSAPAAVNVKTIQLFDEEFLNILEESIYNVFCHAQENILQMQLKSLKTKVKNLSYNRVQYKISGRKEIIENSLKVILLHNVSNKVVVVNYSCHPVCLSSANLLYSNDYIYYIEEYIKTHLGNETEVVFFNGCSGNLNPIDYGTFEIAKNIGEEIGKEVVNLTNDYISSDYKKACKIKVKYNYCEVEFENTITEKFIKEKEIWIEEKINDTSLVTEKYKWMQNKKWIKDMRTKMMNKKIYAPLCCIQINDIVIITLPFEVFYELETRIETIYEDKDVFIIGYANGVFGYLFTEDYYQHSFYEKERAHMFYGLPDVFSHSFYKKVLYELSKLS